MSNVEKKPVYGEDGKIYLLKWNDESKRDELLISDVLNEKEVMKARAKGTTPYELIKLYGGIDEVSTAFANKGVFADVSDVPEMQNDESYGPIMAKLQAQVDEMKKMIADKAAAEAAAAEAAKGGSGNA